MSNPGPATTTTTNLVTPESNAYKFEILSINFGTIAAISANTTSEQTFSGLGTGILPGDVIIDVNKPTTQAGLGIVGWRVDASTNDKFYVTYSNNTAASITPTASEVYTVVVVRLLAGSTTLSAVV